MIKLTSTVSASLYFSYAVFNSAVVAVEPSAPSTSDLLYGAVRAVEVVPEELEGVEEEEGAPITGAVTGGELEGGGSLWLFIVFGIIIVAVVVFFILKKGGRRKKFGY